MTPRTLRPSTVLLRPALLYSARLYPALLRRVLLRPARLRPLVLCLALGALTACGSGKADDRPTSASDSPASARASVPAPPTASRAPSPGRGSKDPDDLNGDGYRDLMVSVPVGKESKPGVQLDRRICVLFGSRKGLDPTTRTVYGRRELGLPEAAPGYANGPDSISAGGVVPADLDGDGFPDLATTVSGADTTQKAQGVESTQARTTLYIAWGGPRGPVAGKRAVPVSLPQSAAKLGLSDVIRGDFDGDGHHDLAGPAKNRTSLVLLYGPFTRSGRPARTDTSLPFTEGRLFADAIDPTGKPRATSLLLHQASDGEQTDSVLYPARRGSGPSADGRRLRAGNAHTFGDFDGDGVRDVAVGDDGSRNDEPGTETEPAAIGGSFAIYPGNGDNPSTHRLPESPRALRTDYGPGGYVSADTDGDGRDGVLVATYEGATLFEGGKRIDVLREGPARAKGRKNPQRSRHARPGGAGDFDADGKDELILNWAAGTLFALYGQSPTHWWITNGTTSSDQAAFSTLGLVT